MNLIYIPGVPAWVRLLLTPFYCGVLAGLLILSALFGGGIVGQHHFHWRNMSKEHQQ